MEGFANNVKRLLESGLDPTGTDADGDTVVHLAAADDDPGYLDVLIRYGVDPDTPNALTSRTPLMSAILAERDPQIERLIAAGADLSLADRTGNTALHVAAQINDPAKVLRLLEAGAPVGLRNAQGRTFQAYLFLTPSRLLSRDAAHARARVVDWLSSRGALESVVTPQAE